MNGLRNTLLVFAGVGVTSLDPSGLAPCEELPERRDGVFKLVKRGVG